ncbi:hypothetical protein L0222_18645 [bacterium]|nr:hypothetical protein [bacterium]
MKLLAAAILLIICSCALAQEATQEPEQKLFEFHGEFKAHYRWSEDSRFPLQFPFPPEFIPRGQTSVFLRTVSPGSSVEVSAFNLIVDLTPADLITGRLRVAVIDLYNRNPTSTDQTVNLKEAWMQFGRRADFLKDGDPTALYVLFGKAPKFERQPDRNLESYGLVSTAFNRFEDHQFQIGGSFGEHLYWRTQFSTGNPVFFRDPNALAGDNGNDDFRFPNPDLHLNSGFPILYDAEVEDVSFEKAEIGAGLGLRFSSEDKTKGVDLLGFYYQRELAERADLRGTFYGGDLDLLDGTGGIGLPIRGNDKEEYGGNVEFQWQNFRVFFQGVHQEVAGLKRDGYEVEILFRAGLPLAYSAGGKQLFTFLQPVFRFSMLDNGFISDPRFVAPSTKWDWRKYDLGVRIGIIQGVDLTAEYSFHDITAARPVHADEFLITLRVRF